MIGGAASAAVTQKAPIIPIVIDTENNVTRCFTPEYAAELDKEYPDITAPKLNLNKEIPTKLINLLNHYFKAANATADYYKAVKKFEVLSE